MNTSNASDSRTGPTGASIDVLSALHERLPELASCDEWLQRMMQWHFSDGTGSPFWLRQRTMLSFDPLTDVRTVADLTLFGLFDTDRLRDAAVRDLIPLGFTGRPARVFETGGTTGRPCRVVDITAGEYNVVVYRAMLEGRGVGLGDVVAMTPSGPHAYGPFVSRLAATWGGLVFFVDFDPRWVKVLEQAGDPIDPYVEHLCAQTRLLLERQQPTLLFTTSSLLLRLAPTLPSRLSDYGIRAVCTGGTACSDEEARYLDENYLDDVQWIDTYGNTLVGHALQADPWRGCQRRAYYVPEPLAYLRVVDPEDWHRTLDYGERGRVLATTLLEDLLIPNLLERDAAVRVGPHPWFPWDGVTDVRPYRDTEDESMTLGVY